MNEQTLVERHVYKDTNKNYSELDNLCWLSKNLYNATLYSVRQHYFETNEYLDYYKVNKEFTHGNQPDYRALPAKVSKQTQMLVHQNFKSFFALLKLKTKGKYDKPIKIPQYLDTKKGRQVVMYEKGALSLKREGYIKLSKTNIEIKSKVTKDKIQFVRLIPKGNHIIIEVGYKEEIIDYMGDNGRYASVDLGLNNLITVSSNVTGGYIINGRPVKAINYYYNKKLSNMRRELQKVNNQKSSKRVQALNMVRNNKVKDYLHKASRKLVNYLVTNKINTLVIGYNKEWKQNINIGRVNNQNFVTVPYKELIDMVIYKSKQKGIKVELQEESYTSKCSFLDNEEVKKQSKYKGKRVKRGLFRSEGNKLINADINGSLNILRKYLEKNVKWNTKIYVDCIQASSKPIIVERYIK